MKINNKLEDTGFSFSDISVGECFMFGQKLYLKLSNNEDVNNTFCLSDNSHYYFNSSNSVQPVHAEITITNFSNPSGSINRNDDEKRNVQDNEVDWSKVEEGTPILVKYDGNWIPRFFVKYKNGKVYAALNDNSPIVSWEEAKLVNN